MSMQDPVADLLTRIRNAQAMGIQTISLPASSLKSRILSVLKQEGFIDHFEETGTAAKKVINVALKYYQGRPVIEKIQRVSRPGLRIYKSYGQLPLVRGGLGIAIISTPKGVMTDKLARAQRLGGEVLCTVE
jgi:small subunit ribosomal protein S8